ncbi:hypothetical protein OCK74_17835 [Chitinophagaceae bacterium LB-8]|uniref:Uncharacterized protein n=1 Tax=Paraflavisolibacter caeni TaxID=2982496 RepID=A0A9X2XWX7_9BACT|nr:hypothetical protein [Paraflavisolibacter caeni]MCU7550984.1 hypothetical protein [Paraflavisolibacter caeni]
MKISTRVLCIVASLCSLLSLSSCYKAVLEESNTTLEGTTATMIIKDSSVIRKLLLAQTWQIGDPCNNQIMINDL